MSIQAVWTCFHFSGMNPQEGSCWVICEHISGFVRNAILFSKGLYHFTFPAAMYEWPSFSSSSAALGVGTIFYLSDFDRCNATLLWFGFACPRWLMKGSISLGDDLPSLYPFCEMFIHVFCPFSRVCFFFFLLLNVSVVFKSTLLKYGWHTELCTYLMYTTWCFWN